MMRVAIFAIVILCLVQLEVLAVDREYVAQQYYAPMDKLKPNGDTKRINYWIKRQYTLKKDNPVFYGTGGQLSGKEFKDLYKFFDKQFNDLGDVNTLTPTIVYVEQRYFGTPTPGQEVKITADLSFLTLDNVINDHVEIIKQLSAELNTKNFLVFGAGHGGVIAGYVANEFANNPALKDWKVLGWRYVKIIKSPVLL